MPRYTLNVKFEEIVSQSSVVQQNDHLIEDEVSIEGPKILIVDDDPFNLVALTGLLNHLGIQRIEQAINGRDALECVKEINSNYDMVITDN
jgi:PleD family two-component response regulator